MKGLNRMANPYMQTLKAMKMQYGKGSSNPGAHVMGGSLPKPMGKVMNFSDTPRVKSPGSQAQNVTKSTSTTKANRVKAKYPSEGKKKGMKKGKKFSRTSDTWKKPGSKYDMSKI